MPLVQAMKIAFITITEKHFVKDLSDRKLESKLIHGTAMYKIGQYEVALFDYPHVIIRGNTKCGLKFILEITKKSILKLTVSSSFYECACSFPNYTKNIAMRKITLKNIQRITENNYFCNWHYSELMNPQDLITRQLKNDTFNKENLTFGQPLERGRV